MKSVEQIVALCGGDTSEGVRSAVAGTTAASVVAPGRHQGTSSALARSGLLAAVLTAGLVVATPITAKEAHEGKSADQVARELANPNNSLASLTFENKFRRNTPVVPNFINNWIRGD
jgi:hypothetical protein